MSKPAAVMDLGTNTFHLLVARGSTGNLEILLHEEAPVKLGEGGINEGIIQPAAFQRGIDCMKRYSEVIRQYDVSPIKAIATSAIRNASNGDIFISEVKKQTGIKIEIIDGNTEAEYIYEGIKAAGCLSANNSLILDIGGGSVELIICNACGMSWKHSFEVGAARLMDKFHRTDPIPPESVTDLYTYLDECLKPLFAVAADKKIENIIGSSGVFESYAEIIERAKGNTFDLKQTRHYEFEPEDIKTLIDKIVLSSHQERLTITGILPIRIDMIVTASLLTRFIMEKLNINKVVMSTSSLKEGVLAGMMG